MAMYTELVLACTLSNKNHQEFIPIIEVLIQGNVNGEATFAKLHPILVPGMLNSGNSSFPGEPSANFKYDKRGDRYFLTVRTNITNRGGELEAFLAWITPYCLEGAQHREFVGYMRYEGTENPTLIYIEQGSAILSRKNEAGLWQEHTLNS